MCYDWSLLKWFSSPASAKTWSYILSIVIVNRTGKHLTRSILYMLDSLYICSECRRHAFTHTNTHRAMLLSHDIERQNTLKRVLIASSSIQWLSFISGSVLAHVWMLRLLWDKSLDPLSSLMSEVKPFPSRFSKVRHGSVDWAISTSYIPMENHTHRWRMQGPWPSVLTLNAQERVVELRPSE